MGLIHLQRAVEVCKQGGIIAYPTESVYGLGCMPIYEHAVRQILMLKHRSARKGLICVAASMGQFDEYVDFGSVPDLEPIKDSWPGPYTWVIPSRKSTPYWLTGGSNTLAIRVSACPTVQNICKKVGPLVSTSANQQGMPPAHSAIRVRAYFGDRLGYIYPANIPRNSKPTQIIDAISGKIVRNYHISSMIY